MKITAIITARNERDFLVYLLKYLEIEQIDVMLIDHGSDDGTLQQLSDLRPANLSAIVHQSWQGSFDLTAQLQHKKTLVDTLRSDWVIHQDADEILQSSHRWGGLRESIEKADSQGFKAMNFNEFVMLPYDPDEEEYLTNNRYFYFFEPRPLRLMRAWKLGCGLSNLEAGGHVLSGEDVYVSPERMILKHFIVKSQKHAFEKYTNRTFSDTDLAKDWHRNRRNISKSSLRLPYHHPLLNLLESPMHTPPTFPESVGEHFWQW